MLELILPSEDYCAIYTEDVSLIMFKEPYNTLREASPYHRFVLSHIPIFVSSHHGRAWGLVNPQCNLLRLWKEIAAAAIE